MSAEDEEYYPEQWELDCTCDYEDSPLSCPVHKRDYCSACGHNIYDFSEYGCEYCDARCDYD